MDLRKLINDLKAIRDTLTGDAQAQVDAQISAAEAELQKQSQQQQQQQQQSQQRSAADGGSNIDAIIDAKMTPVLAKLDQALGLVGKLDERARNAETALENERKEQQSKEIEKLIQEAVDSGKIPNDEAKITQWKKDAEANLETIKRVLSELPASTAVNRTQQQQQSQQQSTQTQQTTNGLGNKEAAHQQTRDGAASELSALLK